MLESIEKQISEMQIEDSRLDSAIYRLRSAIHEYNKLTVREQNFVKDLSNEKWDKLHNKVKNVPDKVFQQVLEAEMALTRLEIDEAYVKIPKQVKYKSDKALLLRMNTLYQ